MKKEILTKGIVLPLIIGIVLAVVFFVFLSNSDMLNLVSEGTQFAYHDAIGADAKPVDVDRLSKCKPNDSLGAITFGDDNIVVRYNADYSNTINALSFVDGVEFGYGVSYLEANEDAARALKKARNCTYDGTFGKHKYSYVEAREYDSRYLALMDAPSINSGIAILYRPIVDYGLTSGYTVLVFEEVA